SWFISVSRQFGPRFENRDLIEQLDKKVLELGDFSWEIGPGWRDTQANSLVFSPGGDKARLEETRRIVSLAPVCQGWEFYPAKPPKNWNCYFLVTDDTGRQMPVDASTWKYVLLRFPDQSFDITICAPDLKNLTGQLRETAAEIVLDGELGEERRI